MEKTIRYKDSVLHYSISGNGKKTILAFHGFGQTKEVFRELSESFSKEYTIYSFDLFFHGKSEWGYGEQPLDKDFWVEIIKQFLTENRIQLFSALGYSLGGKFALTTLEAFPSQVREIFLLAPDGVRISSWYKIATSFTLTRSLFKSMILKPHRFQVIGNFAHKIGMIDKGILRFTEIQMSTEAKRKQVYLSWIVFRHLKFSLPQIASLINSYQISVTAVVGRHDKIMKVSHMKPLISRLKSSSFEILDVGHNGLIRKWSDTLQKAQK